MKFLSYDNLQYLVEKIKEKFVQKEVGKSLSTNDFTNTYKAKLDGLETGSQANTIESIKRNGILLQATNKSVDIKVPVKLSELNNDKAYQTKEEVQALLSNLNKMTKNIVDVLPSTGEEDIFYLVPKSGSGNNVYDEFLWINGKFEKIGDTATSIDLAEISNQEIDVLFK